MSAFIRKEQIAEHLALFIRLRGYSKSSFAKKVNLSRPTINQILIGNSPNETIFNKQIKEIELAFQLPAGYFLATPQIESSMWPSPSLQFSDHLQDERESKNVQAQLLDELEDLLDIASLYL
ncbi:XRE family transcriptional regulator [Sporosarcina sp. FSL K6-3457]|uniref:XRE family transcriptional regulator n=1 Tax=Sporosarcina sp. FSL K6-3457 TaxID=2978204 RepID=UPI0030FA18A7